jgi:probable rRNA maturation factor
MIYIDNRQNKIEVTNEMEELLNNVVSFTLKEECVEVEFEVSVILIDNEEIKRINSEFRNINRETDVLSFPMLEYPAGKVFKEVYKVEQYNESNLDEGHLILGDMALSLEKVMEQSKEYGHSFNRELAYLTVHSMLHLLGYDHMEEGEKNVMRSREEYILEKLSMIRE